jgi:hypothetical protein
MAWRRLWPAGLIALRRIGGFSFAAHYAALGNMFRRKARLILTQFVLITAYFISWW